MKNRGLSVVDIVTRVFVVVLLGLMLSVFVRFFTRSILMVRMGMDNVFTQAVFFDMAEPVKRHEVEIDWPGLYPSEAQDHHTVEAGYTHRVAKLTNAFRLRVDALKEKVTNQTTINLVGYRKLAELANRYNQAISWNLVSPKEYNAVVTMEDGSLVTLMEEVPVEQNVLELAKLEAFLNTMGIDFLYMQLPSKICKSNTELSGIADFSNQNADKMLFGLKQRSIDCFDLRDLLCTKGHDHSNYFYLTDHHWKAETGLFAASALAQYLNSSRDYQMDLHVYDESRFLSKVLKDSFLGAQGKKVTLSRTKPEDFTILLPQFPVDLSLEIPSLGLKERGDFNIIYNYTETSQVDYYNMNPYGAYMYSDNALSSFRNHLVSDEHRLLVIGDSFDNSLVPFFALGVSRVDSLDLRYFTGSLQKLIEEEAYSMVIVNYNPGVIGEVEYQSRTNFFDFR